MNSFFAIIGALKAGESLQNPETLNNRQLLLNVFVAIMSSLLIFSPIPLDDNQIELIAYLITTFISMINMYLTTATSKKIGLKK